MITVIAADPPWSFRDSLPGRGRGAAKHYRCLPVDAIAEIMLPVCRSAGRDAVLFLWRVASMQQEALVLAKVLDFTVKSELVWLKHTKTGKVAFGMGHYVRASHEVCLICTRGSALPEVRNVRSIFEAPVREHSRKPEEFYAIVDAMYPNSPKVELFARTRRAGWTSHGDQSGMFEGAVL